MKLLKRIRQWWRDQQPTYYKVPGNQHQYVQEMADLHGDKFSLIYAGGGYYYFRIWP
jgi:hypothetical protein